MSKVVKYCDDCFSNPEDYINKIKGITGFSTEEVKKYYVIGYFTVCENSDSSFCQYHKEKRLKDSVLMINEYDIISEISTELNFIQSMEQLKQTDIIEYESRMSQFKTQVEQKREVERRNVADNTPKCPTCSSTNIVKIGGLERGTSVAMFGLFSKKINKSFKCKTCGYTW